MITPLIIVQARLESTRFPGKVLAPLLGEPMLLWQLYRLLAVDCPLVVACPDTDASHATLIPALTKHGYEAIAPDTHYRATSPGIVPNDVLGRFMSVVAQMADMDPRRPIVRITGDCPLIDPNVVATLIRLYMSNDWLEYVALGPTWPDGLDVEVISTKALMTAWEEVQDPLDLEHVTPFIWRNMERFCQDVWQCPFDLSKHCWSVDTQEDLDRVEEIVAHLIKAGNIHFSWIDVFMVLKQYKHLQRWATGRERNSAYMQALEPIPPCGAFEDSHGEWNELRYRKT